jgi:predicted phage replisome organizer
MIKMRERKYVKFRVDMLSDTKFKIIDTKPERDLIHYVWMALVLLAGKVNLAGELYISKNMPYTLETLAIEFGREIEQVKLALDVLIELEMIELTERNIYIVKNFAKHQNIKVKEDKKIKNTQEHIKNEEVEVKEEMINKSLEINDDKDENKVNIVQNDSVTHLTSIDNNDKGSIEVTKSQTINNKNKDNISDSNIYKKNVDCDKMEVNPSLENNIPILLESKKGKRTAKKKNTIIDFVDEEKEEEPLFRIVDGDDEIPLREGERVVGHWHF